MGKVKCIAIDQSFCRIALFNLVAFMVYGVSV